MPVPNSRWSAPTELIDGILDAKAKTLDEVAYNQETGAIVPIMAVDADEWPGQGGVKGMGGCHSSEQDEVARRSGRLSARDRGHK